MVEVGPLYAAATLAGADVAGVAGVGGAGDPGDAGQSGGQRHRRAGRAVVRPQLARRHRGGGVQGAAGITVGPGYGTGDAACTPAGGVVEEVTTPGAVGVLSAALFPNYTTPLIGAAVSTVGSAEGAPATVVGVEVGPQATSVSVTGSGAPVTEAPVNGEAVIVLAGAPSSVLGAAGSELAVSDTTGTALATVPLQVEATAPAGPSSLPGVLPAAGPGPVDPAAATQAITQAFEAVFDCATAARTTGAGRSRTAAWWRGRSSSSTPVPTKRWRRRPTST